MKKGGIILLCIFVASLCFLIGMFTGRNLRDDYARLPQNEESGMVAESDEVHDFRLDLNEATKSQLMDLPGIGEMLAERILAYRSEHGPFTSTDDLANVEGIGEKKLQSIEKWIRVGG